MVDFNQLVEELNSDELEVYMAARDQLLENRQTALPGLIDLMLHRTDRLGWRAAMLVAAMRDPSTIPAFLEALKSPNTFIRQTAAQVLGEIGDERVIRPLIEALNDEHFNVQLWAIESLGILGAQQAIEPLVALLAQTSSPEVQSAIIKAFGRIGDTNTAALLPAFFNSDNHHVQSKAHKIYQQLTRLSTGNQ